VKPDGYRLIVRRDAKTRGQAEAKPRLKVTPGTLFPRRSQGPFLDQRHRISGHALARIASTTSFSNWMAGTWATRPASVLRRCIAQAVPYRWDRVAGQLSEQSSDGGPFRSKASTAPSCVRPAKALSVTAREIPAAAASRDIAERKPLKSPPHVVAAAGAAKTREQNRIAVDRNGVHLLDVVPGEWLLSHVERRRGSLFLPGSAN
jgi:hypothetical protein